VHYVSRLIASVVGSGTLCAIVCSASAQSERELQALNNTQHEMMTCAVFYGSMKQCIIKQSPT
jgi:hypothetical protein